MDPNAAFMQLMAAMPANGTNPPYYGGAPGGAVRAPLAAVPTNIAPLPTATLHRIPGAPAAYSGAAQQLYMQQLQKLQAQQLIAQRQQQENQKRTAAANQLAALKISEENQDNDVGQADTVNT